MRSQTLSSKAMTAEVADGSHVVRFYNVYAEQFGLSLSLLPNTTTTAATPSSTGEKMRFEDACAGSGHKPRQP